MKTEIEIGTKIETVEPKRSHPFRSVTITGFLASQVLWIVFTIVVVDWAINTIKPLRFVKIPGLILQDQDPVGFRIESLLNTREKNMTFLLGTSLSDSACGNADAIHYKFKMTEYERNRYMYARYFDQLMNQKLNAKTNSVNLGVGGSMASGQELILKESIKNKNTPEFAILLVAPRDFTDQTRTPDLYPINCYFKNRFQQNVPLFWTVSENKLKERVDVFLTHAWSFFKMRSDYATVLTRSACSIFNRPENAYLANSKFNNQETKPVFSFEEEIFDPVIANKKDWVIAVKNYYSAAYGKNIDRKKLEDQFASFSRSLSLLKENNVTTLVVSMPISNLNRSQIPENFENEYKELLMQTCQKYNTRLIYLLDDRRFTLQDYRDSVHLTGSGSIKFWNILTDEIARDSDFTRLLVNKLND